MTFPPPRLTFEPKYKSPLTTSFPPFKFRLVSRCKSPSTFSSPPFKLIPPPLKLKFPGAYILCPSKSNVPDNPNVPLFAIFKLISFSALNPFIAVLVTKIMLSFFISSSLNPHTGSSICTFCVPAPFNITLCVPLATNECL